MNLKNNYSYVDSNRLFEYNILISELGVLIVFWLGNMVDLYEGLLFLGLIFGFLDIVGVYWGFGVSWEYCGFLVIVFFGIFCGFKCGFIVFLRFF